MCSRLRDERHGRFVRSTRLLDGTNTPTPDHANVSRGHIKRGAFTPVHAAPRRKVRAHEPSGNAYAGSRRSKRGTTPGRRDVRRRAAARATRSDVRRRPVRRGRSDEVQTVPTGRSSLERGFQGSPARSGVHGARGSEFNSDRTGENKCKDFKPIGAFCI